MVHLYLKELKDYFTCKSPASKAGRESFSPQATLFQKTSTFASAFSGFEG